MLFAIETNLFSLIVGTIGFTWEMANLIADIHHASIDLRIHYINTTIEFGSRFSMIF